MGVPSRQPYGDSTRAVLHDSCDLNELEPDLAHGGFGQDGAFKDLAQTAHQGKGDRVEHEPESVGKEAVATKYSTDCIAI